MVCWGCSFDCARGEGGNTPKKHETEPPRLDFTRAIANGTQNQLWRMWGAVDEMDWVPGMFIRLCQGVAGFEAKKIEIEQPGLTDTQEAQHQPYDRAAGQTSPHGSDVGGGQRARVGFREPEWLAGLQAAAIATAPISDFVSAQ